MKVVQQTKNNDRSQTIMETFFQDEGEHSEVQFGSVVIAPGERIPPQGLSCHSGNEYSFIVKGSVEGESGGESFKASAGEATFIPSGEEHWSINKEEEPCEVVWLLVNE
ncbi:cupin domain-containing protein [Peribacillus simplex]